MKFPMAVLFCIGYALFPAGGAQAFEHQGELLVVDTPQIAVKVVASREGMAGRHVGSGFLWEDSLQVVTAYHLIAGSTDILVSAYDGNGKRLAGGTSSATVRRVWPDYDLALLELDKPIGAIVISSVGTGTGKLQVHGFALGIQNPGPTPAWLRFNEPKNLETVIATPNVKAALKITGFPKLTIDVFDVEGNVLPGQSGGPLLDSQRRVIGVVSGGLRDGAYGRSWAIPATKLEQLVTTSRQFRSVQSEWVNVDELYEFEINPLNVETVEDLGIARWDFEGLWEFERRWISALEEMNDPYAHCKAQLYCERSIMLWQFDHMEDLYEKFVSQDERKFLDVKMQILQRDASRLVRPGFPIDEFQNTKITDPPPPVFDKKCEYAYIERDEFHDIYKNGVAWVKQYTPEWIRENASKTTNRVTPSTGRPRRGG